MPSIKVKGILPGFVIMVAVFAGYAYAQTPAITTSSSAVSMSTSTPFTRVPILIYHSVRPYYPGITKLVKEYTVPPDIFDDQLKYLRDNGYTPITLDDLAAHFNSNKLLPDRPVVITFDDGWENQFRYAFPIMKKYGYTGIFYIYSNPIDKKVFLKWDEVKTMVDANMVIGDHTKSHPELSKIKDDAMLRKEIEDSKKIIEAKIGRPVNDFAYPFGDYTSHTVDIVMQAGYKSARTVLKGTHQTNDIVFTLHGIIVTGDFNRFVSLINE